MDELDLSYISYGQQKDALECFEKKDALGILVCFSNDYGIHFVLDNIAPLLKQGIFEEALFYAFTGCRANWSNISSSTLEFLLSLAKC